MILDCVLLILLSAVLVLRLAIFPSDFICIFKKKRTKATPGCPCVLTAAFSPSSCFRLFKQSESKSIFL